MGVVILQSDSAAAWASICEIHSSTCRLLTRRCCGPGGLGREVSGCETHLSWRSNEFLQGAPHDCIAFSDQRFQTDKQLTDEQQGRHRKIVWKGDFGDTLAVNCRKKVRQACINFVIVRDMNSNSPYLRYARTASNPEHHGLSLSRIPYSHLNLPPSICAPLLPPLRPLKPQTSRLPRPAHTLALPLFHF